ncbi:hypothetical protein [Pseudomonas caspiana]|uniref:Uncharacterized protein n=1 Tax=Pseudomonas caspiana TaxID=1451454 RepID=A0A1Y3NXY4_9PSED|nr:hypothetical protein [Pseudomonas caspiana]OUM72436.1 hypothetical protein AUC60_17835 [Pseudomonas caspiana]
MAGRGGANPKWLRLLDDGSQLQTHCLKRLLAAFPELNEVLQNPLWTLLTWDSEDAESPAAFLQDLLPSCRALAPSSYRCRVNARMSWALGVPDWATLAMPLALLRCQAPRRTPQRRWLQEHFNDYLTLASLSPECHGCFADLWVLIDQWLHAKGLEPTPSRPFWPVDAAAFDYQCAYCYGRCDDLKELGWLPADDRPSRLDIAMLWCLHLGGKVFVEKLQGSLNHGARRCPPQLLRAIKALDPQLEVPSAVRVDRSRAG